MTTYRPAHIYLFAVDQHLERKEQKGIARFTRKEKRDFFFLKEKWTCNLPKKKSYAKSLLKHLHLVQSFPNVRVTVLFLDKQEKCQPDQHLELL